MDLPNPGIEPGSPVLQADSLPDGSVYLWPVHVDVWQKPSQRCNYPPIKKNLIKKKKRNHTESGGRDTENDFYNSQPGQL